MLSSHEVARFEKGVIRVWVIKLGWCLAREKMSYGTYLERQRALEMERKIGSIKQPRERRRSGNSKGTFPKLMSDTDRKQEEAMLT